MFAYLAQGQQRLTQETECPKSAPHVCPVVMGLEPAPPGFTDWSVRSVEGT